jgi:hypothetical protein
LGITFGRRGGARPTHLTRLADNDLRLPQLRSPGKLAV